MLPKSGGNSVMGERKVHLILASVIDPKNETYRGVITACEKYSSNSKANYEDKFIATFNKEFVTCNSCLNAPKQTIFKEVE